MVEQFVLLVLVSMRVIGLAFMPASISMCLFDLLDQSTWK